jgi:hypothetical protein
MFDNSIDNKPLFTRPDGQVVRDLTQSMIDNAVQPGISYTAFKVPKDYVMRPDLISKAVYNTTQYAEIILKFNGISNPFSIDEGDIILVPNLDGAKEKIAKLESGYKTDLTKIRNSYKYIDPAKIPSKSDSLTDYDNRQLKNAFLPPNFAEEGTTQIIQRNGRVYFGESVATCVQTGISSAEFLSLAIKNKRTIL